MALRDDAQELLADRKLRETIADLKKNAADLADVVEAGDDEINQAWSDHSFARTGSRKIPVTTHLSTIMLLPNVSTVEISIENGVAARRSLTVGMDRAWYYLEAQRPASPQLTRLRPRLRACLGKMHLSLERVVRECRTA
jgi:hypothetical protein